MNAGDAVFACDAGGSRLKLGLVRGTELLARAELPAESGSGLAAALVRVVAELPALRRAARLPGDPPPRFALAFPGIVEPGTGRILSTPAGKFDDAPALDLRAWARAQRLGGAFVCNDANAALAGEAATGAARGCANVVMVTLGTGFGSAVMIEGVPLRGPHGQAGCLGGHLLANLHGRRCRCGNVGCVETEASTWILPELISPGELADEPVVDYATVFRRAAGGDGAAERVRAHSVRAWAAAIVTLIHAYDPERVVVGGGIMRSANAILPELRDYVGRHAWTPWGKVEIVPAALGNDAGLVGVACLLVPRG